MGERWRHIEFSMHVRERMNGAAAKAWTTDVIGTNGWEMRIDQNSCKLSSDHSLCRDGESEERLWRTHISYR